MGRNSKFSKEEKIEACERYRNGEGSFKSIEKEIGSQKSAVMRWYYTYIEHGDSFFDSSHNNKSYDKEFKLFIVESYQNGNNTMEK